MTNFRSLCAELVDALDQCQRPCGEQPESSLVWKARAALAEQEESMDSSFKDERPDRLIAGDVWEFEAEVKVKGKRKLQTKTLQFKVIGYHHGECAWQLKSLEGEHYYYQMEFAPRYEEMTYVGRLGVDQ